MSMLTKSLKRLYDNNRISLDEIVNIYNKSGITSGEYYYITGEYPTGQPSVDLTDAQRDMVVDEIREGVENGTAN
nr:MAG TPA: hypothetical protein [Caudoviricetes sp.]